MNLGYETGDRVGTFDKKNRSHKSRASLPLFPVVVRKTKDF
jgi:hypothetical protein